MPEPLRRPRRDRMIAGVLAGFAEHFDLDVSLLRIAYAIVTIFTVGSGVLVYLLCWVVIPEDDDGPGSPGGGSDRHHGATLDGQPLDR